MAGKKKRARERVFTPGRNGDVFVDSSELVMPVGRGFRPSQFTEVVSGRERKAVRSVVRRAGFDYGGRFPKKAREPL